MLLSKTRAWYNNRAWYGPMQRTQMTFSRSLPTVLACLVLGACLLPKTRAGEAGSAVDGGSVSGDAGNEAPSKTNPTVGTKTNTTSVDSTTQWMCTKNTAGECTSCNQDADCPSYVCERGYCMDCRDLSQCGAANSCIANRCVPERKPASVWT